MADKTYTLTLEAVKTLAADHRKLNQQVQNLRRQLEPKSKTPYTMPSELVQVWHDSGDLGDVVEANADDLHKGRLIIPGGDSGRVLQGTTATNFESCWILFVEAWDFLTGDVLAVQGQYAGPLRANGYITSEGELLPLYTGTGCLLWGWARLSGDLTPLGNATARVWNDVGDTMTDTGLDITVYDRLSGADDLLEKTRFRWELDPTTGKYYVTVPACDPDTSSTVWGE